METLVIPNPDKVAPQEASAAGAGAVNSNAPKNVITEEQAINSTNNATIPPLSPLNPATAQNSNSVAVGELINGKFLTDIMDALLPALLVVLAYAIGMQIKKSELQLTEKEKNTIAPLVQKCADSLLLNFNNPWTALSVSLLVIYGAKFAEKGGVQWIDKLAEKIKPGEKKPPAKVVNIASDVSKTEQSTVQENKEPKDQKTKDELLIENENWKPTKDEIKEFKRGRNMTDARAISFLKSIRRKRIIRQFGK
jgi:hypothetical protein